MRKLSLRLTAHENIGISPDDIFISRESYTETEHEIMNSMTSNKVINSEEVDE